ncbi:MAG TPA: WG repeat-containing protein [Pyrinomonadaceae bacterium]|nr:WG repeat-containing protein [Pyrinomonadaceae bacterium]
MNRDYSLTVVVGGVILCLILSALGSPGTSRAEADCHDTFIKRVESPDGTVAVYLYHRDCTSANYTYAELRTRSELNLSDGAEVCQLVTLRGRVKMEAVWKDPKHILISSPDLLSWDLGVSSKQDSCNDIKISFDLNIEKAPPSKSSDPGVEAAIRKAIELSTPCFAQRDPHNIRMFYCHLDWGEHDSAVSLVLMHLYDHKCPVSRQVYSLLKMAGTALQVDKEEWEIVRPQVVSSRQAALVLSRLNRATEEAKARIRRRPPEHQGVPPSRLFSAYLNHEQVFIDAAAQLVLEPRFEETVEDFSDGMARISTPSELGKNSKYGYIDTTGKVRIEPQFERVSEFHEGLAYVQTKLWFDEPAGFIDKTGRMVIPLSRQSDVPRFSEGLAAVSLATGFGFIDRDGRVRIEPQFRYAGDFSEGLAWVHIDENKRGYIDKTGKLVIGPVDYQLSDDSNFSEGLAAVRIGNKFGYIDREGRVRIRPQFDEAHKFSGGRARVRLNRNNGYIDKTGQMVIRPQYEYANEFSEGLAAVQHQRGLAGYPQWGFIDISGRMVVRPQYDYVKDFAEGIALVSTRERGTGYIDKSGRYVWGPFH